LIWLEMMKPMAMVPKTTLNRCCEMS